MDYVKSCQFLSTHLATRTRFILDKKGDPIEKKNSDKFREAITIKEFWGIFVLSLKFFFKF